VSTSQPAVLRLSGKILYGPTVVNHSHGHQEWSGRRNQNECASPERERLTHSGRWR
ncbi:hypothetical protein HETIRDRAFT_439479, partial [Heterobasidion irregulare TC 32-1]